MSYTILIADDEREIVELLTLYLEKEDFHVIEVHNGDSVLPVLAQKKVDLVILDIMMPGKDGFQLIKEIRQAYNIPVMFLSARTQDHDVILGLGLGADDYITKPFNPLEVIARIQALLRRVHEFTPTVEAPVNPEEQLIKIGEMILDKASCLVYRNEEAISLTSIEYKILELLMVNAGQVFTKKKIYEAVWGDFYANDDNTIMVHISKLREKIEDDPKQPTYIKTIRGLGYKFEKMVEA
ncbi:response regulator transcription factor [Brevibacillus laterosporus]|uniref:PhoP family transcriptional regulator n=2 Tax=Brevibacillus TaxID=55080 RepID=A0A0F7EHR8_BRELA|nr:MULTISPECIES: response regulator transcription factor [Brevibacillus]AKF94292.1 PhoP family transcriptional regulator [Brevibacillus laterosporus]MCR8987114.1 response regulator transcription factor [Brevibacillus laterosporus]MCZ0832851.1 response regulator transcription factor [Brevibacillus halotolerans]OAJ75551.1 PhoP family transcriptional regulator [Brevibacillus sp. SKDU10]